MKDNELTNKTHPLITPDHLRRLAIVYCRQSTEKQVDQNTGSADFQRSLAEVARSYGWPDSQIEILHKDLGRSGSSTEKRTDWQRLQIMITAKQVGIVFVATISRLSRQVLDFELFRLLAAFHNTLLYTDGRLVDPSNPNDTFLAQVTAMVAHFENRKRAEVMMQSRLVKARKGEVVSRLPIGWIKTPSGKYDYDPETKEIVKLVIDTFWQTRSARRTAITLAKAGIKIPYRRGKKIYYRRANQARVTFILTHRAYTGTYVFGRTQSQPGEPVLANGQSRRIKLPEERWIQIYNNHPAYMTVEQQEEIKAILKRNSFKRRDRAGRGRALTQGLVRCAVCGMSLKTYYPGKTYAYVCSRNQEYPAEKPCTFFSSVDFDQCVIREVLKILKAPPIDMLKAALEASRSSKQTRLEWIESERERLAHEQSVAEARADLTRGALPRVHFDALEKIEKVLQEKQEFEQKIAFEKSLAPSSSESEQELEELCRVASYVPDLWNHPSVTHQERKEVLRCLIDHIVVAATKERIDATIFWKSGEQTPFSLWRGVARHHLIRDLHAQKLTVFEIREHLAAGKTCTGQVMNISLCELYEKLHKMGLKPSRFSAAYLSLREKAAELYGQGRSLGWIAHYFNEQGFASALGKSWTNIMIAHLVHAARYKPDSLDTIHHRLIAEA